MRLLFLSFAMLTAAAVNQPSQAERCLRAPFIGITETSADGSLIGKIDHKDWGCLDGSAAPTGQPAPSGVPPVPPPTQVCLTPAFPNPASGGTRLGFALPAAMSVQLTIYSQSRRHGPPEAIAVRTLFNGMLMAGLHQVVWDLKDDGGTPVPAGIYRAVLETPGGVLCGDIEVP